MLGILERENDPVLSSSYWAERFSSRMTRSLTSGPDVTARLLLG